MKNKIILSCLFIFIAFFGFAQSGKLFTVDKELSSSLINHLYQDRNGLIWMATSGGLNRYDGAKFTIYKHDDKDPNSLLNNLVRIVFEDSKGHLFIGFFNGLQRYDDATDTFREVPLLLSNGQPYASHVLTMLERKNGDILLGTSGQGLLALTIKDQEIEATQIKNLIPSDLINYLYEDQEQNLWVSTQDKGLFRLSKNNELKNFSTANAIASNAISSIIEDQKGTLYVGSYNKGFFALDKKTDTFVSIPFPDKKNLAINTLQLAKDGSIYIGTEGKGMLIYNPSTNKISEGISNVTSIDLSKSKVHTILEDKSGNLWAGIYQKGVLLLPNNPNNFNYLGHKSIRNDIIGSSSITALYKDHQGTLWVGTDGDGIYGLSPDGKQTVHFENSSNPNSVPSTVLSIYEDSNHGLWLGSYLNGLAKLNRTTGECRYVKTLLDQNASPVERVFSITEDMDKNLWIGSMGSGLFKFNLHSEEITRYDAASSTDYRPETNILNNAWIDCLLLSSKGKLFIGTYDGLGCLDLQTNSFVSSFGKNRLLGGHVIFSLYEDARGTIWIGTSKGLMYMESNSDQIHAFTVDDGLASNGISAIRGDKNNNLWISTDYGISKLDLPKRSFFNFYAGDGLQGNEFSKNTSFTDSEGRIFFGGINGITHFNPAQISIQGKELDLHITDFYIHDQAVKKGMKSGNQEIINKSVREADTFHLSHKDNSFSIEFSAMEFMNPERISYMYSLNKDHWITLPTGTNHISFSTLAPGNYTFKVRAKDYNTYSDTREIAIIISPAWYFSTWAKAGYFIFLAALTSLIGQLLRNRYRNRKKIQAHIQAKQINEAKLQFFINIAHEIRTPMSLIISPLKKLMMRDQNSEHQKAYGTMQRNSERILLLINQLMDIRKVDKGQIFLKFQEIEIVDYIRDLCAIFDEPSQSKQIELQFHHETDALNVWVDPKNFDKIILNILSNALKFTPEKGKVNISLCTGKDKDAQNELQHYFEIIIADTGIGIHENELEHIFECFFQTETSQRSFNGGTGIGLHLSRSITLLHHGTIKAENNRDGQGCRFIIRLPLGNSHLRKEEIENKAPLIQASKPVAQALAIPTTETTEKKSKSKSKYRVLVVDDDEEIRKYVCQELASEYQMMECSNGKEALLLALKESPDLIISDIMMPEMDGITLCRKIKRNVNINHIPIILLTAKSAEEDNLEGITIGADAYIVKPFNTEILNQTVKNIIRTREMLRTNYNGHQQQEDKVQQVQMKSYDEKFLEKVMDIISKNIENPSFNVEMLAREVGISRVHLHRKLKELTNQTTLVLIRNTRLQQAGNLLSGKNFNISEVAYAVGFSNLASFSNAFKEFYGVPPTTFMESHVKPTEKLPEKPSQGFH